MLDKVLFSLGSFDVTVKVLILLGIIIVLIIAVIAFRKNYILQVRLSQWIDPESGIHNSQGTPIVLNKRRKKLKRASKTNEPALVIIRIDNLGPLYVGYKNREQLMRSIVAQFRYDLHEKEFVTRMDFDKFCVVMTNRDREQIKEYIASLNKRLDEHEIENYGLYTFYLTCAVYENAQLEHPRQDLELAIATLFYSIQRDGNIYYYTEDVSAKVKQIHLLNSTKEQALENHQFIPYIQPRIDFSNGKVVGGELLVRWADNDQNIRYNPDDFVSIFDSSGFIRKIDVLMFTEACKLIQSLATAGYTDLVISTNFSRFTLNNSKLPDMLVQISRQYSVNPKCIEIEVSEQGFLENAYGFSNTIQILRQNGFRVSLDNFGKEHSSLSLLSNNYFDTIKIDRFFFENNLNTDKEKHVAKNLINLLSKIDCTIILQGIEAKQVLDYVATFYRTLELQGYYFSKPIPLPKFEPFLKNVFEFDYPEIMDSAEALSRLKELEAGKNTEDGSKVETTIQQTPNGGTSINISGLGGTTTIPTMPNNVKEIEELRRQKDEMRHQYQMSLEEQRRLAQEEEMKRHNEEMRRLQDELRKAQNAPKKEENTSELNELKLEIERLKLKQNNQPQPQQPQTTNYYSRDYGYDTEISRLRREMEDLRYSSRERRYYDYDRSQIYVTDRRDREFEILQRQIDDLKENQKNQPVFNIDELIEKLSKTQDNSRYLLEKAEAEAKSLRERLKLEREEREELEALINELNKVPAEPVVIEEEVDLEALEKEQEEADKNLNLDLSTLSKNDVSDDDDEDEEPDKLVKPSLSLEELEAIIQSYRDKYEDEWNQHAKEELQDGYWEIIDGLKYYRSTRQTFKEKIMNASSELKQLYNIVKNEIMKYAGVSNRVTNYYDCFYLGRKQICKISLTSKKVRVYLAADPTKYPERQFPHKDVSAKKAHTRTPYYTMVKSQLSVRRMNKVIADIMAESNVTINDSYKPVDYVTRFKHLKSEVK